jgi:hypothetical protein
MLEKELLWYLRNLSLSYRLINYMVGNLISVDTYTGYTIPVSHLITHICSQYVFETFRTSQGMPFLSNNAQCICYTAFNVLTYSIRLLMAVFPQNIWSFTIGFHYQGSCLYPLIIHCLDFTPS